MDPDTKRSEIEVYDDADERRPAYDAPWDEDHHRALLEHGPEGAFRDLLNAHVASGNVLVVGCGEGELAHRLAAEAPDRAVCGIELSQSRLETAAEGSRENLFFLRADAERLPFDADHFDVVVAHSVLHHLPAWESAALDEICRVLTDSGVLLFYEPGRYNPPAAARRAFAPSRIHTPDERPFVPGELRTVLAGRFGTVDVTGHCIVSNAIPVLDNYLPVDVPHSSSIRLYNIERRILRAIGDWPAWILTGVAASPRE